MKSTSERVERKREARRTLIVETSIEIVAAEGVDALSFRSVAERLDLTTPALYWYFKSKEALLAEVQRVCLERVADHLESVAAGAMHRPELRGARARRRQLFRLLVLADEFLQASVAGQPVHRVLSQSLDPRVFLSGEQVVVLRPPLARLFSVIVDALDEAAECGAIGSGDATARGLMFWAELQGVVLGAKLGRIFPALKETHSLGLEGICSLLRGWGASARLLERVRREAVSC